MGWELRPRFEERDPRGQPRRPRRPREPLRERGSRAGEPGRERGSRPVQLGQGAEEAPPRWARWRPEERYAPGPPRLGSPAARGPRLRSRIFF